MGAAAIAVFTLVLNTVGFGLLKWLGCLRVPKEVLRLHCLPAFHFLAALGAYIPS